MKHLVSFKTAEGRDGQHLAENLEEAVQFVERLRNSEGTGDVVLFRLTEVPIEFKTYYRVEVNGVDVTPSSSPQMPPVPVDDVTAQAQPDHHLQESAAANGRRLFSRT